VDGQRQHPVEKPLDWRQLLKEHPVLVDQPQGCPVGEALVAHRLGPPGGKIREIPAQRRPRDRAFEIVLLAEHALRAGFPLTLRQGPELVESFADRRGKALLAMHIRGADPEEGRADLRRAMRAAQSLNRRISAPARLQQVVPPPFLVLRRLRRVIGPARAARIGEDQDILFPVHEGLGLGGIAAGTALFDEEMAVLSLEGADGPPRHFSDDLVTKGPEDLIQRRGDRGQRHQFHHGRVAQGERLARDDQRASLIAERLGHHVAVDLNELLRMDRESPFEVAENIICRVTVMRSFGFQAIVMTIHFRVSALDNHDASALNRRRTSPHELPLELSTPCARPR